MKNTALAVVFLAFLGSPAAAQFVSPIPVFEKEIRDNTSTKMRSIELDRVKRDGRQPRAEKIGPAEVNNFLEIKADFEKIQTLENSIVTTYKTGKQIQYSMIAGFSNELAESAARLKVNLFSIRDKDRKTLPDEADPEKNGRNISGDVPNLIVELDRRINIFVNNPIFQTPKKARIANREQASADLEQIIKISAALKAEAEKQIPAKN